MHQIQVDLNHCYGIHHLKHDFKFDTKRVLAIYSPNGVMKTSFAKTFKDISQNKQPSDLIHTDAKSSCSILDETGNELKPENIFVVESYNEKYKSEKTSTLLVNAQLRERYEDIHREIDKKKDKLMQDLSKISGEKKGLDDIISKIYVKSPGKLFQAFKRIKEEVLDSEEPKFQNIKFKDIFSQKIVDFLSSPSMRGDVDNYIKKYDELIGESNFFKKGVFNHTNAATVAKQLKNNGFFEAEHTVHLKAGGNAEPTIIETDSQLTEFIEEEKNQILNNPELRTLFNNVDKKLSANKDLQEFRDFLVENPTVVSELSNLEAFKDKLWVSYLKVFRDSFEDLMNEYEDGQDVIEEIVKTAQNEKTHWFHVIEEFNRRFSVPFRLSVDNQEQVILNQKAPVVKFEFTDEQGNKSISETELLNVLSRGEKRALYLLNIIFEVEARKEAKIPTLFVIDDIADSFDYKNKYAIVQYLYEISKNDNFFQIILTHNYDFFRTITSRLDMTRQHKLHTVREQSKISIIEEFYQNNPFVYWRSQLGSSEIMTIASIPFLRNIAEFTGDNAVYKRLTSLLHYKPDTRSILISDLENMIKSVLTDKGDLYLPNSDMAVIELVYRLCGEISKKAVSDIKLESKVCLSMGIRLKAEEFLVGELDDAFWKSLTSNQTRYLSDEYQNRFPNNNEKIKIIDEVNLMTPENIHLNSFMFEPILDMSNHHLISLYGKVSVL